jgi:hypothetical protein
MWHWSQSTGKFEGSRNPLPMPGAGAPVRGRESRSAAPLLRETAKIARIASPTTVAESTMWSMP